MSERDSPRRREGMQGRAEGHSRPFLQVSRRPRRLANYAHGGKYSGRLRHATPRHATCCNCSPLPCPALPPVALPFLRLSLKFTALRHFISGAGGAAEGGGAAPLWAQTFPKCDKTTNRQKKREEEERKQESSECEREIENVEKKMRYMKFLALSA